MSRFNHYFNGDFSGCRHLANAHDPHRDRDVRIYQIPGEIECVGVTDGVDKWIAPVVAELFTVNILKIMRDLHDGIALKLPITSGQKRARRVLMTETEAIPPHQEPDPVRRRPSKSQPTIRQRRVIV